MLNELKSQYDTVELKNLLSIKLVCWTLDSVFIAVVEEETAEMITVCDKIQSLFDPLRRKLNMRRSYALT